MKRPPITYFVTKGMGFYGQWGRLDVTPVDVARAVRFLNATIWIYPPGTTRSTRALLALRGMGTTEVGAIVAPLAMLWGAALWGSWPGAALVLLALIGLWVVIARLTVNAHRHTRRVRARFTVGGDAGVERFAMIASQLDALDAQDLDPGPYELSWVRIYDDALVRPSSPAGGSTPRTRPPAP